MFQLKAKIISNKHIKDRYFICVVDAGKIAKVAGPGQFIQVRVDSSLDPLLRRPLGVHSVHGRNVEIMYEAIGPATRILAQRETGEYLDIIGPLGNGFDYEPRVASCDSRVLVAGGMGVAPLFFLAERLTEARARSSKSKILVLIGARTKEQVLCEKEFKELGCDVKIATDDGSRGFKGKVTDLLEGLLRVTSYKLRVTVYACGPRPMLREISRISRTCKMPAQISLEEHMSCGIGACMGCVVKIKKSLLAGRQERSKVKNDFEYKRVCKEGPVFDAQDVIWD